jgi:alkylated DNA repair protein (DNA oxidative demethylase)
MAQDRGERVRQGGGGGGGVPSHAVQIAIATRGLKLSAQILQPPGAETARCAFQIMCLAAQPVQIAALDQRRDPAGTGDQSAQKRASEHHHPLLWHDGLKLAQNLDIENQIGVLHRCVERIQAPASLRSGLIFSSILCLFNSIEGEEMHASRTKLPGAPIPEFAIVPYPARLEERCLSQLSFSPSALIALAPGISLLPGRAGAEILTAAEAVLALRPPRAMTTPWGKKMSVAMTNCGRLGWVSDADGYRYAACDPVDGRSWPAMPAPLRQLAIAAASEAGHGGFDPEACLINLYGPDARMGLHQDRDEADLGQPIVSVSLGRSARFRIGGLNRTDPTRAVTLEHGDVIVFGGPARLIFHGIDRLTGPAHPILGATRINLTFRRVTAAGPQIQP